MDRATAPDQPPLLAAHTHSGEGRGGAGRGAALELGGVLGVERHCCAVHVQLPHHRTLPPPHTHTRPFNPSKRHPPPHPRRPLLQRFNGQLKAALTQRPSLKDPSVKRAQAKKATLVKGKVRRETWPSVSSGRKVPSGEHLRRRSRPISMSWRGSS
eukprot:2523957-Rhodomonas_salina.1